jgi:hypothetical protein
MRAAGVIVLGGVLLVACSGETGILLSVSGANVDELEFQIAVREQNREILHDATGLKAAVTGRNLQVRPYELFLEAFEQNAAMELRVLVLGWQKRSGSSDRLLSMAWLSPRQRFVSGEVLRRVMRLEGLSSTRALTRVGKCHQVTWGKDTTFRLLPPDDLDCDGKGTTADPPDCNDNDAEIGPGFFEYCDGKENNCDGKPAASTIECYANDTANGGGCFSGTRGCVDEGQNAGPTGACQLTTSVAPEAFCAAYKSCSHTDGRRCVRSVSKKTYKCTLALVDGGCDGTLEIPRPTSSDSCKWKVVEKGDLALTISDKAGSSQTELDSCATITLKVNAPTGSAPNQRVVLEFFSRGKPGWVRQLDITLEQKAECDAKNALTCE